MILCEFSSRYTAALRSAALTQQVKLEERGWAQMHKEIFPPASLLVVEAAYSHLEEVATWIEKIARRQPMVKTVALLPPGVEETSCWRWLLLEAGATFVIGSPCMAEKVVDIAKRHASLVPEIPEAETDKIWNRLPWPSLATNLSTTDQLTTDQ